jgi:ABC-2 type transport system permease protein
MNVFIRECKANRKALIIWSICMFLLILSGMGKYTAYANGGTNVDILEMIPHTMKVLFGLGNFEVNKLSGFFAFLFPYIELTTAVHAVLLGSGMLAKEERDKTTEFLIAKPVSRVAILTAKLLAALFNVVVINVVCILSSIAIVSTFDTGEDITKEILLLFSTMFIIQLIYLSLGAVIAAFIRRSKRAGAIAVNILLAGYVITKITGLVEELKVLDLFAPLNYFSLEKAVKEGEISMLVTLLSILLIGVFSVMTYYFYQRRDMNI